MITEDYVSFEVAKLLKEKRFDENCIKVYINKELRDVITKESIKECTRCFNHYLYPGDAAAPTLQMAMKWLRGLYWLNMYPKYNKWSNKWSIVILSLDDREIIKGNTSIQMDGFISYEEAVEEGIKYCLINLI